MDDERPMQPRHEGETGIGNIPCQTIEKRKLQLVRGRVAPLWSDSATPSFCATSSPLITPEHSLVRSNKVSYASRVQTRLPMLMI
jgi:hypothetical protein